MSKRFTKFNALLAVIALAVVMPVNASAQRAMTSRQKAQAQMVKMTSQQRNKAKAEAMAKYPLLAKMQMREGGSMLNKFTVPNASKVKYNPARIGNAGLSGNIAKTAEVPSMDFIFDLTYPDAAVMTSNTSNTSVAEFLFEDQDYALNAGAAIVDGKYCGINLWEFWGYIFVYATSFDLETGEFYYNELDDYSMIAIETAQDQKTGTIYGEFYNAEITGYELGIADYTNWTRTTIASLDNYYLALGLSSDGYLYGIADDECLYKINKETGEETLVGPTGVAFTDGDGGAYTQGGEINQRENVFIWVPIEYNTEYSAVYSVDLATGHATKIGETPSGSDEYVGLVFPLVESEDGAPAAVKDLSVEFAEGSKSGFVNFVMPDETFAGESISASQVLGYQVLVNGDLYGEGTAKAGESMQIPVSVEKSGMTQFIVLATNEVGEGARSKVNMWVGLDEPKAVENVELKADSESGQITLTWDAPEGGIHGGFIGNITYTVTRYPDGKVVSEGKKLRSFSEILDADQPGSYKYGVIAVNDEFESVEALSNNTLVGGSFKVPFTETFNDADALEFFTVIDANADGKQWTYYLGEVRMTYNTSKAMDDWLITPPIKLTAGVPYVFSVDVRANSTSYPERFEVKMGNAPTASAMNVQLIEPTVVTKTVAATYANEAVVVEESGEYYFGIHGISDPDEFYLFVDNIIIEKGPAPTAPAAVDDIRFITHEDNLKYVISFDAPTRNVAGELLAADDTLSAIVLRDGKQAGERLYTTPGKEVFIADSVPTSGSYSFQVIFYNNNGEDNGPKSEVVTHFFGLDAPISPEDIVMVDQETSVLMQWQPVGETGQNGGYINPNDVTYSVYTVDTDGYIDEQLTSQNECSFVYEFNTEEGEQDLMQLALRASNAAGNGSYTAGALVVGESYKLPLKESFAGGNLGYMAWISGDGDWYFDTQAVDNDGGSIMGIIPNNSEANFYSGKIDINGAANPKFVFAYLANPGDNLEINVVATKVDGSKVILKTIKANELDGEMRWFQDKVDLKALQGERYIILGFECAAGENAAGDDGVAVNFDNLNIADVLEYNVSIDLSAPASVERGQNLKGAATIKNIGDNDAENLVVKFFANDEQIAEETIESLASFNDATVEFSTEISLFNANKDIELKAEVAYALDLDEDDNVNFATVALTDPTASPVTGLEASVNGREVTLVWDEMTASAQNFSESFEEAAAWDMPEEFNGFTFVNNDEGCEGGIFNNTTLSTEGLSFAYSIWNSEDANNTEGDFDAHTGSQMLAAVYQVNAAGTAYVDADNWVISPALNGEAQTISFWANNLLGSGYGDETFEILYSTTDNDIESFIKISEHAQTSGNWTKYSANLPAGAKFFAVRHNTIGDDQFMFMLDDFSFVAGGDAPESFNIYKDEAYLASTEDNTFVDDNEQLGVYTYAVTAVYANGKESAPVSVVALCETKGDVNGDEDVNIADANALIDFILEKQQKSFSFTAADMNGDEAVRVDDLSLLTLAILSKDAECNAEAENIVNAQFNNATMALNIADARGYSAMQFDVNIPEGLTIASINTCDSHMSTWKMVGNNTARVLVYSLQNAAMDVNNAVSVTFAGNVEGEVEVGNVILSTVDSKAVRSEGATGETTGINVVEVTDGNAMFNIAGQQIMKAAKNEMYIHEGKKYIEEK